MNARLSGMARFYLALAAFVLAPAAASAQPSQAQNPATAPGHVKERPPLGSSITVSALGTLPASASMYGLLDTSIPDVIADRIDTGGLSAGAPARVGAHGSTWTQTIYRVGDADITDPGGSGTPMLAPGVTEWDRVDVSTGIMPIDFIAPGMTVSLVPRKPIDQWTGTLHLFGSPSFLNAEGSPTGPAPIVRIKDWLHGNLVAGGPASPSAGGFLSVAWTRSAHVERRKLDTFDANLASAFGSLWVVPDSANQLRLTAWAQRSRDPLEHHTAFAQPTAAERDRALHAQASVEHVNEGGTTSLRGFGSYTIRERVAELQAAPFVIIERLLDGPVPLLLDPGNGTDRLLHAGARLTRAIETGANTRHTLSAGLELSRASSTQQAAFTGRVFERVNGLPARIWDLTDPAAESLWKSTTIGGFIGDESAVTPRLTLNAGARVESIRGHTGDADAAAVSWSGIYPRAGLHFALTNFWNIATFAQYGRYPHRLPLRDLAYGDPTAPTGSVYRWISGGPLALPPLGPVVQRIGPGSGGSTIFSTIDPELKRPVMDEMTFGFESRPHPSAFVRMAAIARRESPLVGVVDVGVPESTYTTIGVPDTGIDRIGAQDDQTLIFYNRSPATFGLDRYSLTNPPDDVATFVGVDFVGEVHARRFFLIAGGTAGRSEGISASRGFGPLENDAAVLGEAYIDPNARGYAQGRLFTERGYTIKTALSYEFERDFTFGLVGRYQDGQHFARMVVMQNLNQGAEAIRAFRNGRTRFTFSMTVDARLQKQFTIGNRKLTFVADGYNIFNQALSVEELEVTGAGERQETAVQPPRVIHLGLRITF